MIDFIKSDKGKILYWIIGIFVALIFAFVLLPPLYATWNRVDPLVCGIPFAFFMCFVFLLVLAICLVLLYQIQRIRGEL